MHYFSQSNLVEWSKPHDKTFPNLLSSLNSLAVSVMFLTFISTCGLPSVLDLGGCNHYNPRLT